MNPRATRLAAFLFPSVIILSLAVHGAVLVFGRVPEPRLHSPADQANEVIAIVMVEPAPPEVIPAPPEPLPPPREPEPVDVKPIATEPVPVLPAPTESLAPPLPEKPLPKKPLPKKTLPKNAPKFQKPARAPGPPANIKARPDASRNRPPHYPEMARRNGWEGRVMVRARVSATGRVTTASISQGCAYGVLNQAALAAVKNWRFRPGFISGKAADTVVEVPVNFSLRR